MRCGGFLLVPMYLLIFGLEMSEAVGTSLLVVAALSVPTLRRGFGSLLIAFGAAFVASRLAGSYRAGYAAPVRAPLR